MRSFHGGRRLVVSLAVVTLAGAGLAGGAGAQSSDPGIVHATLGRVELDGPGDRG